MGRRTQPPAVVIIYPNLRAAAAGHDLDELAAAAKITASQLRAILDGGRNVADDIQHRLACALDADAVDLFHPISQLERTTVDLAAVYVPSITDPTTLRIIDHAHR